MRLRWATLFALSFHLVLTESLPAQQIPHAQDKPPGPPAPSRAVKR